MCYLQIIFVPVKFYSLSRLQRTPGCCKAEAKGRENGNKNDLLFTAGKKRFSTYLFSYYSILKIIIIIIIYYCYSRPILLISLSRLE